MYEMILRVVERPLFEVVMREAGGNQSRAAEWLGNQPQPRCAASWSSTS
jgi:DNA-binding protein Fis